MKGKLNLKYKITSVILAIVSVAACLLFTLNSKTNYVAHAAHSVFVANTSTGEKQFSAKFGGDVIFSVEKVLMNSSITNTVGDAVSYDLTGSTEFVRTFYERTEGQAGGEERLFYDYNYLHEGYSNGKYVVEDGAFVMLENKQQSNKFVTNEDANLTEAIVVSFGQYIYSTNNGYDVIDYPEVYDATNNTNPLNAGVTTLTVNGYHNSLTEKMSNLPGARNIVTNSGIYLDFMFIIPQVAGNDGYYKFDFDYLVNGVRYSESFEFYLLFETTYKSEVEFAANSYNIAPTLGWTENNSFELASETSGYARYYIGKSGLTSVTKNVMSYPTITYDYSKYTFGYTHVANGKSTKYDFAYNYTINSGNISGDITYTTSSGLSTVKPLQYIDETNKLISIILTEPGTYEFEFDFIYSGFNSSTKPDMNLDVEKLPKLYIHGSNLQYSKYNYLSAEMQYYSVSNNLNDKVDFIFPNAFDNISKANRADNIDGKDIADYKNGSIGFTYKVENNQNTRVGEINIDNSQTTLLNADLTNNKTITEATQDNDLEYLTTNVKEDTKSAEVNTIFETLKFEKTNQGSLWFTMNDTYKESFYYYSSNKDTLLDGGYIVIDSETSFNKTGYYLVFLKVVPNGLTDDEVYYQVFAFEYSTNIINIEVYENVSDGNGGYEDGAVVGAGKFTNKNVKVTWKEPDVFERAISAYYYTTTNPNLSRTEILQSQSYVLKHGDKLGDEVKSGNYLKYLIELRSEGESATYKMFTIDRQNISGVAAYVVSKQITHNNNSYYIYDTDVNGNLKVLNNGITDSYASVYWNDKASGANIVTTYTYTPFVKSNDSSNVALITGAGSDVWLTTNYELGTTIGSFVIEKAELGTIIDFSSVLYNQGIYIFTITDEAGNSCKYAAVIDKTEGWFVLNNEVYQSGSYQLFGNTISYNIGTHKAFELEVGDTNSDLYKLITKDYTGLNYYSGVGTNVGNLQNIFKVFNSKAYLTVANKYLSAYDPQGVEYQYSNVSGEITYSENDNNANTSLIRTLYVKGENNETSSVYTKNQDAISKITVEINTDNAKGMVFYKEGDSSISATDITSYSPSSNNRLITGSDKANSVQGLNGAHATNANYVGFIWNIGSGDYEVSKVSYIRYTLNLKQYDNDASDNYNYHFYTSQLTPVVLFENGVCKNGASLLGDGRAFVSFGGTSISQEGLYKVTREYKNELPDGTNDVQILYYYFIVDRNGIIDLSNGIGEHIMIQLLESETDFNNFTTINASTGSLSYSADNLSNKIYSIYLNTTKLPAILNIPTGKYFDGSYGTNSYYSGQLNFRLYFKDTEDQLSGVNKGSTVKIYDSNPITNGNNRIWNGANYSNELINISVYEYLTSGAVPNGNEIASRLCTTDVQGKIQTSWLYLPGTYILYLYDNVESSNNPTNEKLIAFNILKGSNPSVEFSSGNDKNILSLVEADNVVGYDYKYQITTNDEFVALTLPKYISTETKKAQIDTNYLVVSRNLNTAGNAETKYYINQIYGTNENAYYSFQSDIVVNKDGELTVYLDTMLKRDDYGNIVSENLSAELYYLVTIRFKLSENGASENYKNCYKYFMPIGETYWFETTYKVVIDRQAPTTNVTNLLANDNIAEDYNIKNGTPMFEKDAYIEGNDIYYTYQYAKYYQEKDLGNESRSQIYALKVNSNTPFNSNDVKQVLFNPINANSFTISLPILKTDYKKGGLSSNLNYNNTYGSVLNSQNSGYYEIVELDAAGNVTQYIVYYSTNTNLEFLSFNVKTENTDSSVGIETISFETSKSLEIFSAESVEGYSTGDQVNGQYFFKISLIGNGFEDQFLTDFETDFNKISEKVCELINNAGYGNFTLVLQSRNTSVVYSLAIRDKQNQPPINPDLLVDEANRLINVNGANILEGHANYAKQITISYVDNDGESQNIDYIGRIVLGEVVYNNDTVIKWTTEDNITFVIEVIDMYDNSYITRYNTKGNKFYDIIFGGVGNYYQDESGTYYGYTDATIKFDKSIYNQNDFKISINGIPISQARYNQYLKEVEPNKYIDSDANYYYITVLAPYDNNTNLGDVYNVEVQLFVNETIEDKKFTFILDTNIPRVRLTDYTTYESKTMDVKTNLSENTTPTLNNFTASSLNSGIANLTWSLPTNEYFNYVYYLRTLVNGNWISEKLNGTIKTIDAGGTYQLLIEVYAKGNGLYLGNKVYAFNHADDNVAVYYVKDAEGRAVTSNSVFKYEELKSSSIPGVEALNFANVPKTNLPLYIVRTLTTMVDGELTTLYPSVIINNDLVTNDPETEKFTINNSYYTFYMYKIETLTYPHYFGLLIINETTNFVESAKVGDVLVSNLTTSFEFASSDSLSNYVVNIVKKDSYNSDYLLKKNLINLDIYYNNSLTPVKTVNSENQINYSVLGSGYYVFEISDMAGNVQSYNGISKLSATVLREVVVTVNNEVPVHNAYYNDSVELRVYASARYITGSVAISATLNGNPYEITSYNPCVFTEYGNYVVTITADYNANGKVIPLSTNVKFTIINDKEVRYSIDLTPLKGYTITKVVNMYNKDVTDVFEKILNPNTENNSMLVTYEKLLEYAEELNVSNGKQTYTISYKVEGLDYPVREISFAFTLNNENPKIECSLEAGKTTTKGFTISFNAGILYEQIGEAYIKINDKIVAVIDENSSFGISDITTSFENDGEGDYYIQLVSTSGNVWLSYKATIKEPLNLWAIIIIIVVVVVVVGVTITIIVLRNRMRIR